MARNVVDYERSLIGSVLLRPAVMADAVAAGVKAEWFSDDGWSLMWSALEGFWTRGVIESATPINVKAEAERLAACEKEGRLARSLTTDAIQRAVEDAGIGQLDVTARLLHNCHIERQCKKAIAEEMARLESWGDYSDGLCALRDKLDQILGETASAKKISPRAIFGTILDEYDEAHRMRVAADGPRDLKWTPGLKMPWPVMTEFLNGLRAGLHVIAARPSVGKTAFAANLMRFWCDSGYNVLFCSLDMASREVLRRFIAERARVSARKAAFSPTGHDIDAMRQAVAAMGSWPLSVVELHDVDELRTMCRIERSANRLDILVIDYLQLLHARALHREDAVEYARISYVSDALKRVANELNIPVIALAQLNREVTKQDQAGRLPGLADLRGSGSIEQDAFTVTILHRDQNVVDKWRRGEEVENVKKLLPAPKDNPYYKYNFDDLDPVWWILCKAQNGPTGKLPFVVRKKYFAWMLGDYEAEADRTVIGHGAAQRVIVDNARKFERVHSDWRHDPIEELLEKQGSLIKNSDDVQNVDEEAQ